MPTAPTKAPRPDPNATPEANTTSVTNSTWRTRDRVRPAATTAAMKAAVSAERSSGVIRFGIQLAGTAEGDPPFRVNADDALPGARGSRPAPAPVRPASRPRAAHDSRILRKGPAPGARPAP